MFQFSVGEELIGPNLFAVKLSRLQHLPSFCELVQILRAQREAIVKYPEVPQEPRSASKYLGRLGSARQDWQYWQDSMMEKSDPLTDPPNDLTWVLGIVLQLNCI